MKRIISYVLIAVMLIGMIPVGALADSDVSVNTVTIANRFSCYLGSGWTSGSDAQNGIWLRSSSSDASAAAKYVGQKLPQNWKASVDMTFEAPADDDNVRVARVHLYNTKGSSVGLVNIQKIPKRNQYGIRVQINDGSAWNNIWTTDSAFNNYWLTLSDKTVNVTVSYNAGTLTVSMKGDRGFAMTQTYDDTANGYLADVQNIGVEAGDHQALFSNITVGSAASDPDYALVAETAVNNLIVNYVKDGKIVPVTGGYPDGAVTNNGTTIKVGGSGILWESAIMMLALDTYAQTLSDSSEKYNEIASIIANTINRFTSDYTEAQITTAADTAINYAMDDCGWNILALYLGYTYNTKLGNSTAAAKCLDYATKLFKSTYNTFADTDGGLFYNTSKELKSLYAAPMVLGGYWIYQTTGEAEVKEKYTAVYNWIEANLRRADGLYWIDTDSTNTVTYTTPYKIAEAGSVTFLGGNLCMAALNAMMGNTEKAKLTAEGMIRYETDADGAWINDRDAWNNTFALGLFVREVMNKGVTDEATKQTLRTTVEKILNNAVFSDGCYSASWQGPKEPSSAGYTTAYVVGEIRNSWAKNELKYQHGGAVPKQLHTSATTAHVLIAAAACDLSNADTTTNSQKWGLAGDWAVNADDTRLVLTGLTQNNNATWQEALNMPKLGSLTMNWLVGSISAPNTWKEQISFALDGDNGGKLLITLRRYKNGSGNYQIYSRIQYLMNGTWYNLADSGSESSGNGWKWSTSVNTAMSDIQVKIVPNAEEKTITVALINAVSGAAVDSRTVTASAIGEDVINDLYTNLLSCQNAYLRVEPRSGSNTDLYEITNPVVDYPVRSDVWELSDNWTVDEADSKLILNDASASTDAVWKNTLDMTRNQTITMNWIANTDITTTNTWGEKLAIKLCDPNSNDYAYLRFQKYVNGSGIAQVYVTAQYANNGTWSNNALDAWGTMRGNGQIKNMNIVISVNEGMIGITLVNNDDDQVLIDREFSASDISDTTVAEAFSAAILSGTAVPVKVSVPSGNTAGYTLSNPVVITKSKVWNIGDNWIFNETDTQLELVDTSVNACAELKQKLDLTQNQSIAMNWLTQEGSLTVNDTWEMICFRLKAQDTDEYLYVRIANYLNNNGNHQMYLRVQFYNDNWYNMTDQWINTDKKQENVNISFTVDADNKSLQICLTDNDSGTVLANKTVNKDSISDAAAAETFYNKILSGTSITFLVDPAKGNNSTCYVLTNPAIIDYEKEPTQNQFTASNPEGWLLGTDENGITFTTLDVNAGDLIYNAPVNVAAGLELSYDVTAVEYDSNCVNSCLWIRDNSTNHGFFMRLRVTGGGQHQVRIQSYNGSWSDLVNISSWISGSMPGNICKVKLAFTGTSLTLTLTNTEGTVLGTYTADNLPAHISDMTDGKLYFTTDNKGLYTLSNFKGFPEIISDDSNVGAEVSAWNITLGDNIGASFYLTAENPENTTVSVSVAGKTQSSQISALERADGKYVMTVNVAAAQMTDVITVTMSNGDLSIEKTYTICQYAEDILDGSYDDATKALVKEMLNYGAAAQTYFGYNTENMVDASRIEGAGAADIDASKASDIVISGSVEGISFYGASLLFRNRIAVRYYFTVSGDISTYTFIANGKTLIPEQKSGMWYVDVTDVLPQNIDAQITVTVNDTLAVTYGPMNYMVRKSENEVESLKLLLKAMYNYHLAAVSYVNKDAV